jgi:predicted lipoprotein with Yx(FWY)xxD motif
MSTQTMGTATKICGAFACVAGAGLLVAACSSPSSSSSAAAPTHAPAASAAATSAAGETATLKTEHTGLGTVLADSKGHTVYWHAADHGTTSTCYGACAAVWPPVIGTPQAAAGVTLTGKLGTITRTDGVKQATYNGHPLYTFKADTAPGQTHGNGLTGFGAKWYAITVSPSGAATPSASKTSHPAGY